MDINTNGPTANRKLVRRPILAAAILLAFCPSTDIGQLLLPGSRLQAGELENAGGPFQANGVKIGEANQTSVIVWTRLTKRPQRITDGVPFPRGQLKQDEAAKTVALDQWQDSVPGMKGEVRFTYWPANGDSTKTSTMWQAVDPSRDFTLQFSLKYLKPGTSYRFTSECRLNAGGGTGQTVSGEFQTAPADDRAERVTFTVVTGQGFWRRDDQQNGHKIYPRTPPHR